MSTAHQTSRDSLAIDQFEGRRYGPYPSRVSREKVAEFIAATGDDADRWTSEAPPGWAAALLFIVAPHLLADPALANWPVIHGEQRFSWSGPLRLEDEFGVSGQVSRVRERGGVWFVSFDLEAGNVHGSSSFVMSDQAPPAGTGVPRPPKAPHQKESGRFAASRADLIRYAGATGDWNPIHWDHEAALAAGLGGIVVHGLLQAAWILRELEQPVAEARFRFRAPLLVGETAELEQELAEKRASSRLLGGGRELVAASITFR